MKPVRPQGKRHRALAALEAGPATVADLRVAMSGASRKQAAKLWFSLQAMADDGLIVRTAAGYQATSAGLRALAGVRAELGAVTRVADAAQEMAA